VQIHKCDDEMHYEIETVSIAPSGPVQVATEKYRNGWDRTFTTKELN
jgi:hypothetical protein